MLPGIGASRTVSAERMGFMNGLIAQLREQMDRYTQLVEKMAEIEARLAVSERTIQTTRDFILQEQQENPAEMRPASYATIMASVRYIGVRIGTACVDALRDLGSASTEELEDHLNGGGFRFRSGTPLREINAALMRHPRARRIDDKWTYVPVKEMTAEASEADAA